MVSIADGNYSINEVYSKLMKLKENYEKRFYQYLPAGRKFLKEICDVLEGEEAEWEKVESCATCFQKQINGDIYSDGIGINTLMDIFVLILRCMTEEVSGEDKYVIVFDNIERFIGKMNCIIRM